MYGLLLVYYAFWQILSSFLPLPIIAASMGVQSPLEPSCSKGALQSARMSPETQGVS